MQYSPLIKAVDSERRDIVRWLITEKGAPVNQVCKNETALLRAIFRNNEGIAKDLLDHGADYDYRTPPRNWTLLLEAIMRGKVKLFDLMLEYGAKLEFSINGKPIDPQVMTREINLVRFKHERWRRLRHYLKLEGLVGTNTTQKQRKVSAQTGYPVKEMPELNHNLCRLLIENYI